MTRNEDFDILGDIQIDTPIQVTNYSESSHGETTSLLDELFCDDEKQEIFEITTNTQETQEEEKVLPTKNSSLSAIFFVIKYISTSTLIFAVLLVTTNYSAYTNIAKSYIFQDQMAQQTKSLINSVEASNIKDKFSKELEKEKKKTGLIEKENDRNMNMKTLIDMTKDMEVNMDIEITPYENRIVIPKIGKNIPLVDVKNRQVTGANELNDIFMKELEKGVVRYPGSAKPGETGNAFIFGHSSNFPWIQGEYNEVFALLDNVEYDDDIIVYYNQKKYRYRITEKRVINPGDLSILERDKNKSELTVMTCWPIGTTLNRLIVTGEMIEEL